MNSCIERDFALGDIEVCQSPNAGPRRGVAAPDMVVVHYTGMVSAEAALARLRDPAAEVSAHYLIDESGRIFGMVPERSRAWHAGAASWAGREDVNSQSIGVELAHPGPLSADEAGRRGELAPYPEAQYVALERLLQALMSRWRISPERVLGHSDVAPGRKIDPGESFDWPRLAAAGLAIDPSGLRVEAIAETAADEERWAVFIAAAKLFGYGDWSAETVLDAVRRRFHWWMGPDSLTACRCFDPPPPSALEAGFLRALAEKWPVSANMT